MYAFIEGSIADINPASVVISCQGIGYQVNISLNTYSKIKALSTVRLLTHLVVREDALILFGFFDENERNVFQQLITVSGIGPNTARLILSSLTPGEIADAIATENVRLLQSVKGIGGKSAQRIIIDLKGKILKSASDGEILPMQHNTSRQEALSALVMLGFNKTLAEKALDNIAKTHGTALPVDQLIKMALKVL